jgi:hypothetical protein
MYFDFPQLKVTYPGFKPFTEETSGCFDRRLEASLGCTTLELNMRLSLPHHPGFENMIKAAPPYREKPLSPRSGPYGFEYTIRGRTMRARKYTGAKAKTSFFCAGYSTITAPATRYATTRFRCLMATPFASASG